MILVGTRFRRSDQEKCIVCSAKSHTAFAQSSAATCMHAYIHKPTYSTREKFRTCRACAKCFYSSCFRSLACFSTTGLALASVGQSVGESVIDVHLCERRISLAGVYVIAFASRAHKCAPEAHNNAVRHTRTSTHEREKHREHRVLGRL